MLNRFKDTKTGGFATTGGFTLIELLVVIGIIAILAAVVISLMILVKTLPRWASVFALACLIVAHLECPDTVRYFITKLSEQEVELEGGDPDLPQRFHI